jgi:hypothetical protein
MLEYLYENYRDTIYYYKDPKNVEKLIKGYFYKLKAIHENFNKLIIENPKKYVNNRFIGKTEVLLERYELGVIKRFSLTQMDCIENYFEYCTELTIQEYV